MLTEVEKIILKSLDKRWRYIVRDKGNGLFVYTHKPTKNIIKGWWTNDNLIGSRDYCRSTFNTLSVFSHLFHDVKWEDDEPLEFRNEKGEFIL